MATSSATSDAGKDGNTQSNNLCNVIFVLGGPGSGKGTQCGLLQERLGWKHLSAGDLLRAERKKTDSKLAEVINARISQGQIVPSEITVALIQAAMNSEEECSKFIIDGFPRSEENRTAWEAAKDVNSQLQFVLYLDCPRDVMTQRLLERGKTSGRADDNIETIQKRFDTDRQQAQPIVEYYERQGLLRRVMADRPVEEIYQEILSLF